MSLVSIWSLIFERSNPLCCNFFLKVGCTSRKFLIVHIYHLFLFKSFLIYIEHIVHSNLQYRRKMHLKCSCLWIYRDGIWMNQRQWLDNCRGYQILHWQDNRLLAIVRRTKMMTSYRQIPVPSNKSFIKHPKNLCLFTTKQAGRTLIHRDIRSRTASKWSFSPPMSALNRRGIDIGIEW